MHETEKTFLVFWFGATNHAKYQFVHNVALRIKLQTEIFIVAAGLNPH